MITEKQIQVLEKRAAYLKTRIEESGRGDLSYDLAECAALLAAMADLKRYMSFEPALSEALAILDQQITRADNPCVSEILTAWRMMP